jgi:hypothetical protein
MQCKALPLPYTSIAIHVHICTYRIHTQLSGFLDVVYTNFEILLKKNKIQHFFVYLYITKT